MAIKWRGVAAPDFSGVSAALDRGVRGVSSGLEGVGGAVDDFSKQSFIDDQTDFYKENINPLQNQIANAESMEDLLGNQSLEDINNSVESLNTVDGADTYLKGTDFRSLNTALNTKVDTFARISAEGDLMALNESGEYSEDTDRQYSRDSLMSRGMTEETANTVAASYETSRNTSGIRGNTIQMSTALLNKDFDTATSLLNESVENFGLSAEVATAQQASINAAKKRYEQEQRAIAHVRSAQELAEELKEASSEVTTVQQEVQLFGGKVTQEGLEYDPTTVDLAVNANGEVDEDVVTAAVAETPQYQALAERERVEADLPKVNALMDTITDYPTEDKFKEHVESLGLSEATEKAILEGYSEETTQLVYGGMAGGGSYPITVQASLSPQAQAALIEAQSKNALELTEMQLMNTTSTDFTQAEVDRQKGFVEYRDANQKRFEDAVGVADAKTPKELADELLARGEIGLPEHQNLLALGAAHSDSTVSSMEEQAAQFYATQQANQAKAAADQMIAAQEAALTLAKTQGGDLFNQAASGELPRTVAEALARYSDDHTTTSADGTLQVDWEGEGFVEDSTRILRELDTTNPDLLAKLKAVIPEWDSESGDFAALLSGSPIVGNAAMEYLRNRDLLDTWGDHVEADELAAALDHGIAQQNAYTIYEADVRSREDQISRARGLSEASAQMVIATATNTAVGMATTDGQSAFLRGFNLQ